jgi:hypothetical protein
MDSILLCQMFNLFVFFLFIIILENTDDLLRIEIVCRDVNMVVFKDLKFSDFSVRNENVNSLVYKNVVLLRINYCCLDFGFRS